MPNMLFKVDKLGKPRTVQLNVIRAPCYSFCSSGFVAIYDCLPSFASKTRAIPFANLNLDT